MVGIATPRAATALPAFALGARAVERCDQLGVPPYSDAEGQLDRRFLTPAHRAALDALTGWMVEAGMSVRLDAAALAARAMLAFIDNLGRQGRAGSMSSACGIPA
jgi:hypothetical protein